jgi:hypothetical protein
MYFGKPVTTKQSPKKYNYLRSSKNVKSDYDEGIASSSDASNFSGDSSSMQNVGINGAFQTSQRIKKESNTIQVLDLKNSQLRDEGIMYISMPLKTCASLKSLNIANNSISDYGMRILLENINKSHLKVLDLSLNKIGLKGVQLVVNFLNSQYCKVQVLNLRNTGIEEEAEVLLANHLSANFYDNKFNFIFI